MYRRSGISGRSWLILLLATSGFLTGESASADSEYWVSVGSYRDLTVAEVAQREASTRLPESFTVTRADTEKGVYYRVLAGPYLSKEIAEHMQDQARRSGFDDAWLLAQQTGVLFTPVLTDPPDLGAPAELDEPFTFQTSQYSVPDSKPADIPGFNVPDRPDRDRVHQLIVEAPEGYRLNSLHRR